MQALSYTQFLPSSVQICVVGHVMALQPSLKGGAKPASKGAMKIAEFSALMCSYMWVDDDTIGALVIPEGRCAAPEKLPIPLGPNVQDNSSGKTSQVRLFCTDPEGA